MEILIISGLSGSGKSKAASFLEDMGFYIVDKKALKLLNLGEGIVLHGKPSELYRDYKLDGNGIAEVAVELIQGD